MSSHPLEHSSQKIGEKKFDHTPCRNCLITHDSRASPIKKQTDRFDQPAFRLYSF